MTSRIGWIVAGAIVLVLAVGGGVTALVLAGGEPTSVQEVADQAVEAAEDLDVEAGIDLLCETPPSKARHDLERLIEEAQDRADTDDPDVDYDVSHVQGDSEGSFEVRITSDEEDLEGEEIEMRILVESRDGRSCITTAEPLDD